MASRRALIFVFGADSKYSITLGEEFYLHLNALIRQSV